MEVLCEKSVITFLLLDLINYILHRWLAKDKKEIVRFFFSSNERNEKNF